VSEARPFLIGQIGTSLQADLFSHGWSHEAVRLLQVGSTRPIRVVNFAEGGRASDHVLAVQLPKLLPLRPDAVLVDSSMNDWQQLTLSAARANLTTIFTRLKLVTPAAGIFGMSMSPTVGADPAPALLASFYADLQAICGEQGVGFIDNYTLGLPMLPGELPVDGHPILSFYQRNTIPNVVARLRPLV
jgi:hypothetical protein